MKKRINSKILKVMIMGSLLSLMACGDGEDSDTNITINPVPELQREEGPVSTSPTVVVNNRINNKVRVINRSFDVKDNNLNMKFRVVGADPVVHQHNIFVANNCNQIINSDLNNDQLVEEAEIEQTVGQPVAVLVEAQGSDYEVTQSVPLDTLPANSNRFAFVVFGAEEGVTVPIACNSFTVDQQNNSTTTTTTPTTTDNSSGTTTTTTTTSGPTVENTTVVPNSSDDE